MLPATGFAMLGYSHNLLANLILARSFPNSPHAWARAPRSPHPTLLSIRVLAIYELAWPPHWLGVNLGSTPASPTLGWSWFLFPLRHRTNVLSWLSPPGLLPRDELLCHRIHSWGAIMATPGNHGYAARRRTPQNLYK